MSVSAISEILADFKAGRMVILIDEEDRENEGDLVLAADFVSPEAINFMARHGRGLICLTLTEERCRRLGLTLMSSVNGTRTGTNFTVSIEAAEGVTTGISAADRARTIQVAVAAEAQVRDLVQPGHVFPIMARNGGVLMRAGHTEAGCDLGTLTGLTPASVICEVMNEDGTMARLPDLIRFGQQHGLKIGTIADLIEYRSAHESLIERLAEQSIQTQHGPFRLIAYRDKLSGSPHLALAHGAIERERESLVRVHEPVSVLDLLEVQHSAHAWTVDKAMSAIAAHGQGVLVLLNCAQSASVLVEQLRELARPEAAPIAANRMDLRTYGIGAQILRDLGVGRMRLLAQPRKMPSMAGYSLEVVGFEGGDPTAPVEIHR